ncbi:hypothetical protein HID58_055553, partial [Brassica napus]
MEDFLELEEFLELEDGEKLEDLDSSREVTMEDFLELEEWIYMSMASHPDVHEHQRPPISAEEAVGFHKRVKRIHDPVKIVVPFAVVELEFPIPPDRCMQLSPYIG